MHSKSSTTKTEGLTEGKVKFSEMPRAFYSAGCASGTLHRGQDDQQILKCAWQGEERPGQRGVEGPQDAEERVLGNSVWGAVAQGRCAQRNPGMGCSQNRKDLHHRGEGHTEP